MNEMNASLMGVEWNNVSALSSGLVSVACFVWFFIIELDDTFPLAACVAMACKAIYDLSITGREIND